MVDVSSERVGERLCSQNGGVGVVALAEIKKTGQTGVAEVAEVEVVEAILGTAQGEDHGVVAKCLGELGEVLALVLATVATSDDKDALQLTCLDCVDHLKRNGGIWSHVIFHWFSVSNTNNNTTKLEL